MTQTSFYLFWLFCKTFESSQRACTIYGVIILLNTYWALCTEHHISFQSVCIIVNVSLFFTLPFSCSYLKSPLSSNFAVSVVPGLFNRSVCCLLCTCSLYSIYSDTIYRWLRVSLLHGHAYCMYSLYHTIFYISPHRSSCAWACNYSKTPHPIICNVVFSCPIPGLISNIVGLYQILVLSPSRLHEHPIANWQ